MFRNLTSFLEYPLITWEEGKRSIEVGELLALRALLALAKLPLFLIQQFISRRIKTKNFAEGKG